jgi:hypothetical protein
MISNANKCEGKITAFLQAFGISVCQRGLGNMLQCRSDFLFLSERRKNKINPFIFALISLQRVFHTCI